MGGGRETGTLRVAADRQDPKPPNTDHETAPAYSVADIVNSTPTTAIVVNEKKKKKKWKTDSMTLVVAVALSKILPPPGLICKSLKNIHLLPEVENYLL